jgi:hypothetical protein
VLPATPVPWRFRSIEPLAAATHGSPELDEFKNALHIASATTFKLYHLSAGLKYAAWLVTAAAAAGLGYLVYSMWGFSVGLGSVLAIVIGFVILAFLAKLLFHRVLRNPNPLWQIAIAVPLLILGGPLTWISTQWLDPIYLRCGPRYRK